MNVPTSNSTTAVRPRKCGFTRAIPSLCLLVAALTLGLTGCKPPAMLEKAPDPLSYRTPVGDGKITVDLLSVVIQRTDDTIELIVQGNFTNNTGEAFETLRDGKFKLINGEGQEVPYFFHSLSEEKFVIEPGTTGYGHVRFRPTMKDFEGPLYLAFNDAKKMIKDRKPIGDERLPSTRGGKKCFIAVDWTHSASVLLMPEK